MKVPPGSRRVDPEHEARQAAKARSGGLLRVELTEPGPGLTELRVGGRVLPVAAAVLRIAADRASELEVTLPVLDGLTAALDARVKFSGQTRAALVAMGWTPPDD